MNTKHCTKCKQEKPLDEYRSFRDNGRNRIRVRSQCYSCELTGNREHNRRSYHRHPLRWFWSAARSRAARFGLPFDLKVEDIQLPERCPVFGYPLEFNHGQRADNSVSLDRIVPELGYVRGNVRVISWRANSLRSNATLSELKRLVEWLQEQEE